MYGQLACMVVLAAVLIGCSVESDEEPAFEAAQEVCWSSPHDCGIKQLPEPEYPHLTEADDADCALIFKVLNNGSAEVLRVHCDDTRFDRSVTKSAGSIRYAVQDGCDRVCPQIGSEIEYPIKFRLDD